MAGYPASSPHLFKKCKQVAGAIPAEVIPVTERQPHTRTRSRAVDTDEEALSGPHDPDLPVLVVKPQVHLSVGGHGLVGLKFKGQIIGAAQVLTSPLQTPSHL